MEQFMLTVSSSFAGRGRPMGKYAYMYMHNSWELVSKKHMNVGNLPWLETSFDASIQF